MTYKISEIDALVENMRYLLTQNNTQMKRVEIPTKLLSQAQELIKNRTGLTNITNKTLVIYALLINKNSMQYIVKAVNKKMKK